MADVKVIDKWVLDLEGAHVLHVEVAGGTLHVEVPAARWHVAEIGGYIHVPMDPADLIPQAPDESGVYLKLQW